MSRSCPWEANARKQGQHVSQKAGVEFQTEQMSPLFSSIICARLWRGKDKDDTISVLGGYGTEVMGIV